MKFGFIRVYTRCHLRQGGYIFVFSSLFVCFCASNFAQKNFRNDLHEFFLGKVGNGPLNKRLNFGGDLEPIRQMAALIPRHW